MEGKVGKANNKILGLKTPVLFVIGQNSSTVTLVFLILISIESSFAFRGYKFKFRFEFSGSMKWKIFGCVYVVNRVLLL